MVSVSFALGHRPAIQPRQWQSRLIQLLRSRVAQPSAAGQDVLIHAGPGAGKTLGALLGVQQLLHEGRAQRFVVFCHRTAIAAQWRKAAGRLGLRLDDWSPDSEATGLLLSYQAAALHRERLEQELHHWHATPWVAIADEVHHLGVDPDEPEAAAWGHAFSSLTAGAALRLGLTGTPFRADQLAFCAARRVQERDGDTWVWRIVPDLCVEPRQLISAGDVRPLEFRFQDGWVDHARGGEDGAGQPDANQPSAERSCLSAESRESWRARNLRRAIRLADSSSIAERVLLSARDRLERVRQDDPGAGGLVIARDIAHAKRLAALLIEQGEQTLLVHSLDPEAEQRLAAFQQGQADWLVSIDMCSEGFDAARLRVVAYLSTVVTRSRFVQAITRAVRLDGGREASEPIPRHPSYVFAPADPLLISHARSWSISEPYLLRDRRPVDEPLTPGGSWNPSLPMAAVAAGAGAVIAMGGPQLPDFVQQRRPA
ncbi:MAG: DEAD/DEAH box helicase family protein [Cyanobacteriota bacterium]|nr:DEAD/DEAH box helicase family protein [Cyanobacteriota bacterium]